MGAGDGLIRPWVPISLPLTDTVYLELIYLAPKAFPPVRPLARPFEPDTMTNTAPEASSSSSGNKISDYCRSTKQQLSEQ